MVNFLSNVLSSGTALTEKTNQAATNVNISNDVLSRLIKQAQLLG